VRPSIVYSARYQMDIGPHVFPTRKYSLIQAALVERGLFRHSDFIEPEPASWGELALVHTGEYLTTMRDGSMSPEDLAQLELPWSHAMVEGFRMMVGGTVLAAKMACGLHDALSIVNCKLSIHVGGGLHHAFPNHGEGFCPFNDVAVAARVLLQHGIERVAIVDLDVHHGNGTAFIFNPGGAAPAPLTRSHRGARAHLEQDVAEGVADRRVFTFSMHQQHNYPMWKPRGSLDIGLPDGTHDDTYLKELERALPIVMASDPQCVFYLAGADPYEDDQLGGLRLTREGLRLRDRLVMNTVRAAGIPLAITLAGGYARNVDDTVAIHVATIEEATKSS
jgi:acetoin utilization deacetylase AcuC-like enzyme